MNRKQAMAEAARLWGKRAAVRDEGKPTSKAKRDAAIAEGKRLRAAMDAAAHGSEEWRRLRKEVNEHLHGGISYRYSVGHVAGVAGISFFHVMGQGDTWAEAFEAAARDYGAGRKRTA